MSASTLSDDEIRHADRELRGVPASEIVRWAADMFGSGLCLAASMTDAVLIDLATRVDPDIEVVFLDTGFHFAETLGTLREAMARHELRVTVVRPNQDAPDVWNHGTEACCERRKVLPLDQLLARRTAWLSGLRWADSPDRAGAPVVGRDRRGLVKVNPIAAWTDDDVESYIAAHGVIVNPLVASGYPSIGCWPCTEPVVDGEDLRAGRWVGSAKTECGIHL